MLDNPQYENLSNVNPYEYVNKVAPNKALVVNDVLEYYNFLKSLDSTIKGYTVHTMLPGIKQSLLSNNYMIKKRLIIQVEPFTYYFRIARRQEMRI